LSRTGGYLKLERKIGLKANLERVVGMRGNREMGVGDEELKPLLI
jgi:hypothetical protein